MVHNMMHMSPDLLVVNVAQINYQIPVAGDYRIYVESSTPSSSIEFCAY